MSASTDSAQDDGGEEFILHVPDSLTITGSHEGPEDIFLHVS